MYPTFYPSIVAHILDVTRSLFGLGPTTCRAVNSTCVCERNAVFDDGSVFPTLARPALRGAVLYLMMNMMMMMSRTVMVSLRPDEGHRIGTGRHRTIFV